MKIKQKLSVAATMLIFVTPVFATETVRPPVTPPGEAAQAQTGRATGVGGTASLIEFALPLVMEYGARRRIDADIKGALSRAVPKIQEALAKSGDKGVLLTARTEKLASGGHGVSGETTRLVGGIAVGDTGAHPILAKLKTASLGPTISSAKSTVEVTPGYVPDQEFNRMYWAKKTAAGKITFTPVNIEKLRKVVRIILTKEQARDAMQQLNYAEDLTSRIRLASINLKERDARNEAAALLREREKALKAAEDVERWLNEELGRAKRANQAANTAGMVSSAAAIAAAGYGAAQGSTPVQQGTSFSEPNSILIESSTINQRSEDFLKDHPSVPRGGLR